MRENPRPERTDELGQLFVSVTGDEAITEPQEGNDEKRPLESGEEFDGVEDGLDDAVDPDLGSEAG